MSSVGMSMDVKTAATSEKSSGSDNRVKSVRLGDRLNRDTTRTAIAS